MALLRELQREADAVRHDLARSKTALGRHLLQGHTSVGAFQPPSKESEPTLTQAMAPAPTFGHAMREHWLLDPEYTYLNHGTVGAPPRRVLERQQALRDELERQPARFMLRELAGPQLAPWRAESRIREAARSVAGFLGSRAEDLVFVPNVTTGLNAVLRSIRFAP